MPYKHQYARVNKLQRELPGLTASVSAARLVKSRLEAKQKKELHKTLSEHSLPAPQGPTDDENLDEYLNGSKEFAEVQAKADAAKRARLLASAKGTKLGFDQPGAGANDWGEETGKWINKQKGKFR
ncbi:unnamed protein product [Chrysoparadoxa australica]